MGYLLDQLCSPLKPETSRKASTRTSQDEVPEDVPDDEVPEVCAAVLDERLRRFRQITPWASMNIRVTDSGVPPLEEDDENILDAIEVFHANWAASSGEAKHCIGAKMQTASVSGSLDECSSVTSEGSKHEIAALRGGDPSATARFVLGGPQLVDKKNGL